MVSDTLPWNDHGAQDGGPAAAVLPVSLRGGASDAQDGPAWGDRGAQYGGPTAVVPSVSPHAKSLLEQYLARLQSQHQQHVQYVMACAEASAQAQRQKVVLAEHEAQTLVARQ
eukprot:11024567-Alexandrium_andersonii.AAC.1